jgi:hypothetical protein
MPLTRAVSKALSGDGTSNLHPQPLTCITVAVVQPTRSKTLRMLRMQHQARRHQSGRQRQVINPTVFFKTCRTRERVLQWDGRAFQSKGNVFVFFCEHNGLYPTVPFCNKAVTTTSIPSTHGALWRDIQQPLSSAANYNLQVADIFYRLRQRLQ